MALVLIVDAGKSSVVMSSEVFKDKLLGTRTLVAGDAKTALDLAKKNLPDMIVVDFDLPDADGTALIVSLRAFYKGPILLTAYPDKNVIEAVSADLFVYDDASDWLAKPISVEKLAEKIEYFLVNKGRIYRRFDVEFDTTIVPKKITKKTTKDTGAVKAKCINISMTGALLASEQFKNLKVGTELILKIPKEARPTATLSKEVSKGKKTSKATAVKTPAKKEEPLVKDNFISLEAKVAWTEGNKAGFVFKTKDDRNLNHIEGLLRQLVI